MKRSTMKRIISVFLAAAIIVLSGYEAVAKKRILTKNNRYGDFTYSVYRTGDCAIREYAKLESYDGKASNIKLPASIRSGLRKIEVSTPPARYKKPKRIKRITLESRLKSYQGEFSGLPNLKAIQMKKDSRGSYTKKGVLFGDFLGGIWLRVYPCGKRGKSYRIPEKVAVLGGYAFENCKKLKSVTLPENLLEINDYAFYGCKSLKKVTVPKWVSYIGSGAFKKCRARVTMPPNMKKVKDESKEGFHYELFVDCRLNDDSDSAVRQVAYREIHEIRPEIKKVELAAEDKHKLETEIRIGEDWHTLLSKETMQYKSSNPKVATVNSNGVVKAKKKGTVKITVKHRYMYEYHNYVAGKYTVKVTVK